MNCYTKENTCKGKVDDKCAMWKAYKEECPFFREEGWEDKTTGDTWITFDCAIIRTMYASLETRERVLALQQANEEQRNNNVATLDTMLGILDRIVKIPITDYNGNSYIMSSLQNTIKLK